MSLTMPSTLIGARNITGRTAVRRNSLLILFCLLFAAACTKPVVPGPDPETPPDPVTPPGPVTPPAPEHKDVNLMSAFTEEFPTGETETFSFRSSEPEKDFRYYPGFPSLTEKNKTILLLRPNPADKAGEENGAVLSSRDYVYYGSYSARIRIPDVASVQPGVDLRAAFSLRDDDSVFGFDEMTLEFRMANRGQLYSRVCRKAPGGTLSVKESTLTPSVSSFNAASKFYIYGMDWTKDKVIWWIQTSSSGKSILYEWTENIPSEPLKLEFRLYHGQSHAPLYPYELEIDWIKYTPQ